MNTDQNSSAASASPSKANGFSKNRTRFLSVLGFLTVSIAGVTLWAANQDEDTKGNVSTQAPPAPTVTVAPVQQRMLVDTEERLARIDAVETVHLRPEVSGRIVSINFVSGDRVEAGQVLFEIDPRVYQAAYDQQKAALAIAEAQLSTAEREAKRATALYGKKAVSSEEHELRLSSAAEARAELEAAKAELETARIDLDRTKVRSPIEGRASRAYVTKGNLVSAGAGDGNLLTTIVSIGDVHAYVEVDTSTVHRFRKARQRGEILLDEAGRIPVELKLDQDDSYNYRGYVESLDNQIDPQTGSLTVRLTFPDPTEELLPGAFARVRLPVSARTSRLIVSERAVGTDQSKKFVLVVSEDNIVTYRQVSLGSALGSERIIVEGVNEGERVIVAGLQRVRPGMTVTPEVAETLAMASSSGKR